MKLSDDDQVEYDRHVTPLHRGATGYGRRELFIVLGVIMLGVFGAMASGVFSHTDNPRYKFDILWREAKDLVDDGNSEEGYRVAAQAVDAYYRVKHTRLLPDKLTLAHIYATMHYLDVGQFKDAHRIAKLGVQNMGLTSKYSPTIEIFSHLSVAMTSAEFAFYTSAMQRVTMIEGLVRSLLTMDASARNRILSLVQFVRGWVYLKRDRPEHALSVCEKAHQNAVSSAGPESYEALQAIICVAASYSDTGRLDVALEKFQEAFDLARAIEEPDPEDLAWVGFESGKSLLDHDRLSEADIAMDQAEALVPQEKLNSHPYYTYAVQNRGILRSRQGRHTEALDLLSQAKGRYIETFGADHIFVADALTDLADAYEAAGDTDAAKQARARADVIENAWVEQ